MQTNLPVAYVFGNANVISISLINELLLRNLFVIVVSENESEFKSSLPHGSRNLKFESFDDPHTEIPHYIFLVQGFSVTEAFVSRDNLNKFYKFVQDYACKTEIVLPYVLGEASREYVGFTADKAKELKSQSVYVTYLGEVYGQGYTGEVLARIAKNEKILVPNFDSELYLVDTHSAINALLKGIFSYGFNTNEIVITSKTTIFAYIRLIKEVLPQLVIETDPSFVPFGTMSCFDFLYIPLSEVEIKKTITSITVEKPLVYEKPSEPVVELPQVKINKPKVKFIKPKKLKRAGLFLLFLIWIILLPFISLFISSFTLRQGLYSLKKYDLKSAYTYFNLSNDLANFSKPFFGFFKEGMKATLVINDFSKAGNELTQVFELGQKIGKEAQGDSSYDIKSQSNKLYFLTDDFYRSGSYLLADIKNYSGAKFFVPDFNDLDRVMNLAINVKPFIKALPNLFGADQKTSYLVLFQNDKDLWPSGGRIESVGVYTFYQGRLVEKNILNPKDIDSQLKGSVVPPLALSKYLGVGNWSLKDSNWDSDFQQSAIKAEWFLEKETGDTTNGVIAINSSASDDLSNFNGNIFEWAGKVGKYLSLKEAQVYVNNNDLLASLTNLNWDGGVAIPKCTFNNCFVNWTGVVEANMGNNEVGPQIIRSEDFTSDLSNNIITNKLEININNSSTDLPYKAYIRVLAPSGSFFGKINGTIAPEVIETNGRTEAGTYILLPAGQSTKLVFSWTMKNSIKFNVPGEMMFYMRKQPGVSTNPTNISFTYPASLTQALKAGYNTSLTNDFSQIIKW
jgi:hypothetical protein